MEQTSKLRIGIIVSVLALGVVFVLGLLWTLFSSGLGDTTSLGKMGWFVFSFAFGLTMIVMPCTLPLAFVIVPLAMGKGMVKGIGMALSFGLGVALMLSTYGLIAAALGKAGIDFLGAGGEDIKNWIYFLAGIFAYVFALGEIGLIRVRMPSYTGSAPDFIQKRKDFAKAFLLGLFLGNVGVGCPHPATPLILIEIASSGDLFYGWALFLVHAIGRVVPLLFLALLAVLGVNGLNWLVARKERIERATGWAMVFVAGFILTLGLFSHDWWVNSGQHNLLERVTQEHWFNQAFNMQLGTQVAHVHGLETGYGIFGQPLEWGNWFLVLVWIIPFWWHYFLERRRVLGTPALQIRKLEQKLERIEEERRGLEVAVHIPEGEQGNRVKELEAQIDALLKERVAIEEAMRYGAEGGLRDEAAQRYEEELLKMRRRFVSVLTAFLFVTVVLYLPTWFRYVASSDHGDHAHSTTADHAAGSESMPHEHADSHMGTSAGQQGAMVMKTKVADAMKIIDRGVMAHDESIPHTH